MLCNEVIHVRTTFYYVWYNKRLSIATHMFELCMLSVRGPTTETCTLETIHIPFAFCNPSAIHPAILYH